MKRIEKESLETMIETLQKSEVCMKEIGKLMDKSIVNIEKAIEELYYKYKKRYNLDDQQALEYLHQKLTPTEINKYAEMGLYQIADATSTANQINRLFILKRYIIDTMDLAEKQSTFYLEELLKDIGNTVSSKVSYSVGKEIGYVINWDKIPKKKMDKLLKYEWCNGGNFYTRQHYAYGVTKQKLKEVMVDGITRGISPTKMSANLQEVSNYSKANSDRLVITEANRFHNEVEGQSYEEIGIEKYMIMATLDGRTCQKAHKNGKSCAELDGQIFKVKDREVGVNYPVFHPRCRCTTVMALDNEDKNKLVRRYKVYNQKDRELQAKIDKIKAKKKAKRTPEEQAFIDRKYKIGHYEVSDKYLSYKEYIELMQQ